MSRIHRYFMAIIPLSFCLLLIGLVGVLLIAPRIRDFRTRESLVVMEGAEKLFENRSRLSGNYLQQDLVYWNSDQIGDVEQYYQSFVSDFIEVNSYERTWLISLFDENRPNESLVRESAYIHTDLCDYQDTFDCITITLIDNNQPSVINSLPMFELEEDKLGSIPDGGTLIIFTYTIPS